MLVVFFGYAGGSGDAIRPFGRLARPDDAHLDFADAVKVLLEFVLVVAAEPGPQPIGVFGNEIENTLFVAVAFSAGSCSIMH